MKFILNIQPFSESKRLWWFIFPDIFMTYCIFAVVYWTNVCELQHFIPHYAVNYEMWGDVISLRYFPLKYPFVIPLHTNKQKKRANKQHLKCVSSKATPNTNRNADIFNKDTKCTFLFCLILCMCSSLWWQTSWNLCHVRCILVPSKCNF